MSGPIKLGANPAEHLAQLTKEIDPKKVDDKTLGDIVSLLDTSNDFVRAWVAGALGLGSLSATLPPSFAQVNTGSLFCHLLYFSLAAAYQP